MTFLVYIETQNFTRILIEKSTCSTKELSINMTKSLSAVTGGLQSYCDKVNWHNSFKQMWILRYCKDILDHFNSRSLSTISPVQTSDVSTP